VRRQDFFSPLQEHLKMKEKNNECSEVFHLKGIIVLPCKKQNGKERYE